MIVSLSEDQLRVLRDAAEFYRDDPIEAEIMQQSTIEDLETAIKTITSAVGE